MLVTALTLGGGLLVNAAVVGYFLGGVKSDIKAIRDGLDDKITNKVMKCRQTCPYTAAAGRAGAPADTAPRGVPVIPDLG